MGSPYDFRSILNECSKHNVMQLKLDNINAELEQLARNEILYEELRPTPLEIPPEFLSKIKAFEASLPIGNNPKNKKLRVHRHTQIDEIATTAIKDTKLTYPMEIPEKYEQKIRDFDEINNKIPNGLSKTTSSISQANVAAPNVNFVFKSEIFGDISGKTKDQVEHKRLKDLDTLNLATSAKSKHKKRKPGKTQRKRKQRKVLKHQR